MRAWSAAQAVQEEFRRCQATYDPNNIVSLLQHFPFHVDSLLAMADLERSLAHHEQAEDYLQRAVYALEMAWHPRANPVTADVTLSYDEPINRPLFKALFLHAQVWGYSSTPVLLGVLKVRVDALQGWQ